MSGVVKNGKARSSVRHADLETRVNDEDHQALRLWLRLLTCTNRIESEIRGRLRAVFETTLPRFDLMAQLERCPEGLKMSDLSRRLMVTGGNITGITDQLEREGLVVRISDPVDRRAFTVQLTPVGRKLFAKMAAVHEQWVIELFGSLSGTEKQQAGRLLAKLKLELGTQRVTQTENVGKRK